MKNQFVSAILAIATAATCSVQGALSAEELFATNLSLDQGKALAKKSGKYLIVDLMSKTCGPCKMLDAKTWPNPSVAGWLKKNAVTMKLEIEKNESFARQMRTAGVPTIFVYRPKDAEPFDIQSGFMQPNDMVNWFEAIAAGKNSVTIAKQKAAPFLGKGGEPEVGVRYDLVTAQMSLRDDAGATEQYVWLWKNMPKLTPELSSIRATRMADSMKLLAHTYAPAKVEFQKLRSAAEPKQTEAQIEDWIVLNEVLQDEDKTLAWFDQIKKDPKKLKDLQTVQPRLEDLLSEHHRLADLVVFYPNPEKDIVEKFKFCQLVSDRSGQDIFPIVASRMYIAFLASGQDDKAKKLADQIFKLRSGNIIKQTLAITASSEGQVRPWFNEWLETPVGSADPVFYAARGSAFLKLKKPDKALADYDHALKMEQHPSFYIGRSKAYEALGKKDLAQKDHALAIKMLTTQ